jgi:WD40 repeat protein
MTQAGESLPGDDHPPGSSPRRPGGRTPRLAPLAAAFGLLVVGLALGAAAAAWWFGRGYQAARQAQEESAEQARRADDGRQAAEAARRERREELWRSYLAQARAGRLSRSPGQRFNSLQAVARAAALRPSAELRDEAIACLALPDLRPLSEARPPAPAVTPWSAVDVRVEKSDVVVRNRGDSKTLARLGHAGPVEFWRGSADGRFLVACVPGRGQGLRPYRVAVWDWRAQKRLLETEWAVPREGPGLAWGFAAAGRWFYCTDAHNVTRTFDLATGRALMQAKLSRGWSCYHDLNPDARLLAVCGPDDPLLRVVDLASGRVAHSLRAPGAVRLAWRPDGRRLAVALARSVHVWDVRTGRLSPAAAADAQDGLAWDSRGDWLAACGGGGQTELIEAAGMQPALRIDGEFGPGFTDGDRILGGAFEAALPRACRTLDVAPRDAPGPPAFSPDGRWVALAGPDGVSVQPVADRGGPEVLPVGQCEAVVFHPSGDLMTYGWRRGLERWPLQEAGGRPGAWRVGPPVSLGVHPGSAQGNGAAGCRDGRLVLGDWHGSRVVVLDPQRPGRPTVLHHPRPRSVAFSPDGRFVAAGDWQGASAAVWDLRTGRRTRVGAVTSRTQQVSFSADGDLLFVAYPDRTDVHRSANGKKVRSRPRAQRGPPVAVACSADGELLACCDRPSAVTLLRAGDYKELAVVQAPGDDRVCAVQFSPDGRYLAATLASRAVLWDLAAVRDRLGAMGLAGDWPAAKPGGAGGGGWVTLEVAGPAGEPAGVEYLPTSAEHAPVAAAEVAAWVQGVRGGDPAAEDRLAAAGPGVLPALEKAAGLARGPERGRLARVRDRIEAAVLLAGRRVSLKLGKARLADALDAVRKQSGLPIRFVPGPGELPGPVSLALDDAPSCAALGQLCRSAGLTWFVQGGEVVVTPGKLPLEGMTAHGGPFRLLALSWREVRDEPLPGGGPAGERLAAQLELSGDSPPGLWLGEPRVVRVTTRDGETAAVVAGADGPLRPVGPGLVRLPLAAVLAGKGLAARDVRDLEVALPVQVRLAGREVARFEGVRPGREALDREGGRTRGILHKVRQEGSRTLFAFGLSDEAYPGTGVTLEVTDVNGETMTVFAPTLSKRPRGVLTPEDGLLMPWLPAPLPGRLAALALGPGESFHEESVWFQPERGALRPPLRVVARQTRTVQTEIGFAFRNLPPPVKK